MSSNDTRVSSTVFSFFLMNRYKAIADIYMRRGEIDSALEAATSALDVLIDCFGNDHKETDEARMLLNDIKGIRS
jgi:hypothetical protein